MRNFTGFKTLLLIIRRIGVKVPSHLPHVLLFMISMGYAHADALTTPACPIISGTFQGLADGTTSSNTAIGWTLDASGVPASRVYFAIKSNRIHAEDLGGVGIWRSNVYSTAGYANFRVAVKVHSEGDMNSSEYAKIYYKINGGSEVLWDERTGNFGTIDFISPELTGSNVQLIVRLYNYNNGGSQTSKYHIEEYRVFKEVGPCSGSISVSASTNRTVLTCSNPSATLSASSTASGVTYAWTGPNGFSSTSQNPVVSTAGTYTVTGTSASGTGTASVTLTENKAAPGVNAAGGSLACASTVTLTASSPTSGVTYSWTGPNGFTSSAQNPVAGTAGTYTVLVNNAANGCTSQQSVTVSSSGTSATFWLEDFTFNNGTTSDTGTTSWTSTVGSGTFSVQANEFRVSGTGTSTQGVWTSGVIDISGKTNVNIAVDTRSSGELNSTGDYYDYLRVYYKLNGGTEVMFNEQFGNISGVNTVTAGTFNGSTLQIIIRARASGSDEFYYFDNVKLTGTSQTVTATASVNGTLTCANTTRQLSGSASISNATYSWTGPNGFTSTSQSPTVTAPGTYTLTVANSSGCSGTASVTVSQDIAAPGASASVTGSLSCGSSVTLNGSSGTSNVSYGWTGPGNFSSNTQNPVVSVAGTYTLTVTNPANGCTSTATAQVTSAATTTTLWLEDFPTNGATSDTGTTPWTSSGSGTFSVTSNEFKMFGAGASSQAVWTSGTIDITNKANVTISVGTRSSGVNMNTSGTYLDYLRIYYKLNGGAEVLFSENLGNVNNHSTTNTTVSIGSLSGTSLQVIVKARATGTDEFYYFDNVKVTGTSISSSFTVSAAASRAITCANANATLTATGSVSGLSYSWTGPNGFTSVQQNPVVTAGGQYTVTASQGGCAATASVTVTENKTAPQLTASGATLTCATSGTVSASSTVSNVSYAWTGPGGFTATQSNPTVTTPGTYTVTITNPANGCTNSQSVTVTTSTGSGTASDFWVEDFTFTNGTTVDNGATSWSLQNGTGTFSVQNNEIKASFPSANEGVWLSGVVDISAKSDVIISALLKSGTAGSSDALEEQDYIRVFYKLNGGAEVLAYENFGGMNDINSGSQSYNFTSTTPLNGSTLQVVIRVNNSHTTEYYFIDNVKLNGKPSPLGVITASANGAISCTNTSVQLSASSTATGATYYWIRPDGTTISQQNPTVTTPGNYTVVVSANGCQATQTVTVAGSKTPPDVSIIGNNFSCSGGAATVNLTAYSSVSGVTYAWTGPGTITNATAATASVASAGTFTVTATNPANACTSTASFTVGYSDGTTTAVWNETFDELSDGTTSENGATGWSVDNSKIHTVNLSAYSDETGTPYYQEVRGGNLTVKTTRGEVVWTSQQISIAAHGQVQLRVDVTGEGSLNDETDCGTDCFDYDYVKIFYKLNGGVETPFTANGVFAGKLALNGLTASTGILSGSTVQIIIRSYNTGNNEIFYFDNIRVLKVEAGSATVNASVSGPITCTNGTATLSATPVIAGATYAWSGPGNTTYTGASVNVAEGGTYNLTVSGSGGCVSGATASVVVSEDKIAPIVNVSTPDVLTCTRTSLTLTAASSPASGVNYLWTRPDGSTLSSTGLTVTTPGNYSVKVTNPANGCFAVTPVTVYQNNTLPDVTASANGSITCNVGSVNLVSNSTTQGVTYLWTGPGAITNPTSSTATVSTAGTYTVKVTDPSTGCEATRDVVVTLNNTAPGANASVTGQITCDAASFATLSVTPVTGANYAWTGPGTITNPTSATATTKTAGTYTVTVTLSATGCQSSANVTVTENKILPGANATATGQITCNPASFATLSVTPVTGATYAWTGPGTITNPASATATTKTAGTYTVTVTLSATGCQSSANVTVAENKTAPGATASVTGVFTCVVSSVTLNAMPAAGVSYQWSGPQSFTSPLQNPVTSVPGTYTVTVTSLANGCTSTSAVTTVENKTPPGVTVSAAATVTCDIPSATLGASSVPNASYSWSGPEGFSSNEQTPNTSVGGTYTVTATDPNNGCTSQASTSVISNKVTPENVAATIAPPGMLNCANNVVTLNGATSTTGVSYAWTGPEGYARSVQNPTATLPGIYVLTVTNTSNGCKATAEVTVTQSNTAPQGVTATALNMLNCTTPGTTINGTSATANVSYSWTGPGTFTSLAPSFTTNVPGTYTLTVTDASNNCSAAPVSVTITEDKTPPQVSISNPDGTQLTCFVSPVRLFGSANPSAGASYRWTSTTGLDVNTQNIQVTTPGNYMLTVTGANGCQGVASRSISQTLTTPTASASVSGVISCRTPLVSLDGGSSGTPVTYSWTGPQNYTSTAENPDNINLPGTYTVTILTPGGCTDSETVTVERNMDEPQGVTATYDGEINCGAGIVVLMGNSETTGATYKWEGPGGFESTEPETVVTNTGTYTLTVTHPDSGCVIIRQVIIEDGGC